MLEETMEKKRINVSEKYNSNKEVLSIVIVM